MAEKVVHAACPHDCPDTCAMLVTVEDGVATKIQGDPSMPFTDGTLCTKVAYYLERTYAPDRLLYPMRRIGKKGEGRFKRIGWDEALDEIATRLRALAAEDPQTILPCSYAGTMGMVQYMSMDRRFFNKLGASQLDRTLCSSAGKHGIKATLGGSVGMDPERFEDANLILLWGANPIVSNLHLWSRVQAAKRRGAKVVAIDPYRSLSAEKCTQHVALRPGTDGMLALGMMHVLITEDLLDHDYIARHTLGFDALKRRVLQEYTPARAAEVCGLEVAELVQLARDYGTAKPAAIRLNYGMQRHAGGGIAARTIACLPALTGAWRDPAGGIVLTTAEFSTFDHAALERPDLLAGRRPRVINHSALGDALTAATPPVKALIVYNNNPVAVCPDSAKVIAGFSREDLFTVVMDHFQTDTADYADLVLPATTQLEHYDVHKAYGHLYLLGNSPAIAPVGESLPNSEVFRRLAARHGIRRAVLPRIRRGSMPYGLEDLGTTHGGHGLGAPQDRRLEAPRRAGALRAVRRGRLSHAVRQVRALQRMAGEAGHRSAAVLQPAGRSAARELRHRPLPARLSLPAGAPLPQFHVLEPGALSRLRGRALPRHASRGRRRPRHPRRRSRASLQRAGQLPAESPGQRQAARRRRGGAVGLVEKARAGRSQCERCHLAAHRGPRRRGDVLRLRRPGGARGLRRLPFVAVHHHGGPVRP